MYLICYSVIREFVILGQCGTAVVNVVVVINVDQRVTDRSPLNVADVETLQAKFRKKNKYKKDVVNIYGFISSFREIEKKQSTFGLMRIAAACIFFLSGL